MERKRAFLQGLGIIVFGVIFIALTSALYFLSYVKGDHVFLFLGLSGVLIFLGVVAILVSKRAPSSDISKPQRKS